MPHSPEQLDATVDRNLRRLGGAFALPVAPTAEQRARWRSGVVALRAGDPDAGDASATVIPIRRAAIRQRMRRWLTTAGSAVAAGIVLAAFYFVPTGSSEVAAATIFRSLREAARRGIDLRFEQIRIDDLMINSHVQVVFPRPVTLMQLVELRDVSDPQHVYVDLALQAGPNQPEIAGLDLELVASFRERDAWGYFRVNEIPTRLIESRPLLAGVATLMTTGVLVDLDGLDALLKRAVDTAMSEAATNRAVAKRGEMQTDGPPVEGLLRGLMAGTLSSEQLSLLVAELERSAGRVTVSDEGPGRRRLTAGDFRFADPQSEDARMLAQAELMIDYREGAGVEACELAHVGAADGSIRFVFVDALDESLASRQRYLDRGARQVSPDAALRLIGMPAK